MSKIKLTGSNSGYVEISSAADAGNLTLALPTAGTALLSNAGNVFTGITTFTGVNITDDITFNGASYNVLWDASDNALEFGDNAKLSFGASSDLQLYHDGNHSYISDQGTGKLRLLTNSFRVLETDNATSMIAADDGGAVLLSYDGTTRFETTNTGAVISGICTATSFSGSGEGLTRTTQYSHRNVIVNGSCLVAQRGTSSASSDYGSVDRMKMTTANLDQLAFLQKQTSDGPDGFKNCFEFDVTTPENALDANDLVYMRHMVERQDLVPFFNANGTGKNFTLSFYVKAYQTGTYQVAIYKHQGPRFITRTYTIASSGVWQRVVLNFPGDTNTSGMDAANTAGFQISWIFAAGTNYTSGSAQTTWGSWPGNPGFAAGHAVNVASSANNYWRITGIQLELGDIATPFEHRSFGDTLMDCYRYYVKLYTNTSDFPFGYGYKYAGTAHAVSVPLPTRMRTEPTCTLANLRIRGGNTGGVNNSETVTSVGGMTFSHGNFQSFTANTNVNSAAIGASVLLTNSVSNNTSYINFDAEL